MNDSEADRRSHRFASGVGVAKTNTNGTTTITDKDVLDGPVITHVHRGTAPEVYAARQSPLCKRVIAKANGTSQRTFAATRSAGTARQAALQSLESDRRGIVNKAQSRTARALATVAQDPNVLVFSVRTKRDGKLHKIATWRPATRPATLGKL